MHVSETFSRPERGRTAQALTEIRLVLVFPVFLKRRLVAAPLPLTQGALKQPSGGTRAPVTNDLVLTGGLAILERTLSREEHSRGKCPKILGNSGFPFQEYSSSAKKKADPRTSGKYILEEGKSPPPPRQESASGLH